jgi:hypothetical protein
MFDNWGVLVFGQIFEGEVACGLPSFPSTIPLGSFVGGCEVGEAPWDARGAVDLSRVSSAMIYSIITVF